MVQSSHDIGPSVRPDFRLLRANSRGGKAQFQAEAAFAYGLHEAVIQLDAGIFITRSQGDLDCLTGAADRNPVTAHRSLPCGIWNL